MKTSSPLKQEQAFQGSGVSGTQMFYIFWCIVSGLSWKQCVIDFGLMLRFDWFLKTMKNVIGP